MIYTKDTWPSFRWPNFSFEEMACRHTGECDIDDGMMTCLQAVRNIVDRPLTVTSGYRHPTHPAEAAKPRPGAHARGLAVDIACDGELAYRLIHYAPAAGFTGIGVSQKGDQRFVHLDCVPEDDPDIPRPRIWSY